MASRWIDASGVALTGMGLVGALGYDASTALAAARAGVSRASVQPHWRKRSGVSGLEEPVVGHAAPLLTSGFEGTTRLLRLAQGALLDLQSRAEGLAEQPGRTGLYLAWPDPDRTRVDSAPVAAAGTPEPLSEPAQAENLSRAFASSLWPLMGWERTPALQFWSCQGHAAGALALGAAAQDLQGNRVDTALVLGVDSLVDDASLTWLAESARLKCDDTPSGLMPGEAAASLMLQRAEQAESRLATLQGLAWADEPLARSLDRVSTGEVLCEVLAQAWAASAEPAAWLLADLNGEHARAHEWGAALARLRGAGSAFADPAVWLPALNFGDTGAASPVLAAAMAVHAWQRGCAPASAALVAACADRGTRAALLMKVH